MTSYPRRLDIFIITTARTSHLSRSLSLLKSIENLTLPPPSLLSVVSFILLVKKVWHIGEYLLGIFPHYSCVPCFSVEGLGVEEEHHSKIIHCEMYTFIN